VNRSPVSCIPSPESPAKRMTTWSRRWTGLLLIPAMSPGSRCGSAVLKLWLFLPTPW